MEFLRSYEIPSTGETNIGISYVYIFVVSVAAVASLTGYESTERYPTPEAVLCVK